MTTTATSTTTSRQPLIIAALALGCAALAAAWYSELALGYTPCKLCLLQRWPYYIGLPMGLFALLAGGTRTTAGRVLLALFALAFALGALIAVYHAGAEWKFWPGPSDCGGRIVDGPASVLDLRNSLKNTRVIRCDEAAMRILGLSFAGWNIVISVVVAALAAAAIKPQSR